jgi:benzodiazapine receptor
MGQPLLYSLVACVAGAVLEALFAGSGIKQRLAELRLPPFAPPLWAWALIGLGYYTICFAVSYRLLSSPKPTALTYASLALLGGLMFVNAFWNYFFFRTRNLYHAFLVSVSYSLFAMLFFLVLLRTDLVAAGCLSPYVAYLLFGNIWGYRVWKLNPPLNESSTAA